MATRWGIVGAGKISNDFASALSCLGQNHKVMAVAGKDKSRVSEFARRHQIPTAYVTYDEIAKDENIDVVYVGVLNPQHLSVSKLMLEHCKHVLCEKPLCMNYKEAESLIKLAKEKNLFLMEALWSRFFPAYTELRNQLESGSLGDVLQLSANFAVDIADVERTWRKKLGGSAVLDIGVYLLQLAMLVFGRDTPRSLTAVGHLNAEGTDESLTCVLKYPEGRMATLVAHTRLKLPNEAWIVGTKGSIKICEPFWSPTELVINGTAKKFPLPQTEDHYVYVNSVGLSYQAVEVRRCLQLGLTESPLMNHDDSLVLAKLEDEVRRQLGVKYEQDSN